MPRRGTRRDGKSDGYCRTYNDIWTVDTTRKHSYNPITSFYTCKSNQTNFEEDSQVFNSKVWPFGQRRGSSETCGASLDTIVVHEDTRNFNHELSSGETAFLLRSKQRKLPHPQIDNHYQKSIDATIPRKSPAVGEIRRMAGSGFHRNKDRSGTMKAQSMMRVVDDDDYLLVRGANPRTGMITPGVRADLSSIDEESLVTASHPGPPAKWRQRGDQWVSCDLEEPTPSLTPRNEHPLDVLPAEVVPPVGTDTQLLSGHSISKATKEHHSMNQIHRAPAEPKLAQLSHLPSTQPLASNDKPDPKHDLSVQSTQAPDAHGVKRKPLGATVLSSPIHLSGNASETYGPDDTRVSTKARSASGPLAQRRYFSPDDVGKDFTEVPFKDEQRTFSDGATRLPPSKPTFLGRYQRPIISRQDRHHGLFLNKRVRCEETLASLPMNNGPYQLPHSRRVKQDNQMGMYNVDYQEPLRMEQHPIDLRRGAPIHPHMRPMKGFRRPPPHSMPNVPMAREMGMSADYVSNYGIHHHGQYMPVPSTMNMTRREMDHARRGMQPQISRSSGGNAHVDCQAYTSMNTTIPTHICTDLSLQSHLMNNRLGNPIETYESLTQEVQESTLDVPITTSTSSEKYQQPVNTPPAQLESSAPVRPPMHMRAEAMNEVPRVEPTSNNLTATATVDLLQSSAIGMEQTRASDIAQQSLRAQQDHHDISAIQTQPTGLTRKCSRCQNGYVQEEISSIAMLSQAQDNRTGSKTDSDPIKSRSRVSTIPMIRKVSRALINTDKTTTLHQETAVLLTSTDSVVDTRDHSACCPECCKEQDCHDGCLGHPSPGLHPVENERSSIETSSSENRSITSTPSTDTDVSAYFRGTPARNSKLALIRSALAASFQHRKNASKASLVTSTASAAENSLTTAASKDTSELLRATITVEREDRRAARKAARKTRTRAKVDNDNEANEGRRVVSGPRAVPVEVTVPDQITTTSRNVSGSSIEMSVPKFGFEVLGEMIFVPFEAVRMWLRNNPQVIGLGWQIVEHGWNMCQVMLATSSTLYSMTYVYSKTGKLRVGKGTTVHIFMRDCLRSLLYLVIFTGTAVFLRRLLGYVFVVLRICFSVLRGIGWVIHKVGRNILI